MKHIFLSVFLLFLFACNDKKVKDDYVPLVQDIIVNVDIVKREEVDQDLWDSRAGRDQQYSKMIQELINKVLEGKLKAYPGIPDNEQDTAALTISEVNMLLSPVDTFMVENVDSAVFEPKITETIFEPENITSIRFREDWFYNRNTFKIEKEIKAMQLVRWEFTEQGEFKGDKPLMWIKF